MDGSLCDHPVRKLLELCERHRLTGVLEITSWGRSGRVELRAGQVTAATFGALQGQAATAELTGLRDGLFALHQALPHVSAGGQRGEPLPLSAVIEQCRARALSCHVEVVSRKQRAVITYRAGELEHLELDGGPLPDGLSAADVLAPFENGQVKAEALPLLLQEPASAEAGAVQAAPAPGDDTRQVPRPAGREGSQPALVAREDSQPARAAREDSRPNRAAPPPVPLAAREGSRPNRVPAREGSGPNTALAAREDSRPNRAAPPPVPVAAREGSRPNRVPAREGSRPNRVPARAGSGPNLAPAAREDSRPNRAAPPPVPLAAREGSRPNRVPAREGSGPNPAPAAREGSGPHRAAPPPVPVAAREGSRPNRVPAREGSGPNTGRVAPVGVGAREDSQPNRAPAAGARPVPRPRASAVANPTVRPVALDPSSNGTSVPVALGRAQADGPGPAQGVGPWLDNPDPSGAIASPRNALASRRELAVPAVLTVIVLSLLLIIGFVALQQ
jgi:hypothetical protein